MLMSSEKQPNMIFIVIIIKLVILHVALRPATLLKKRMTQVFSCEFSESFKNTFFAEHLRVAASQCFSFIPVVHFPSL